jgi:3-hydroxybutyryl-CoA dehydrogenase
MAMIAGTGMTYHGERMGPWQLADTLGLDYVLAGLEEFTAKPRRALPAGRLLRTKVRAGHLGKKVGKGFHEYA